VTVPEKEGL
jgi:hypothetical protein